MRTIPDPGFAGDTGDADPGLAAALAAYDRVGQAAEPGARHEVLALLQDTRVLVPVVAVLGELEDDFPPGGLAREKSSDMAAVLMKGRAGGTALLAFTGTASLRAWDREARPVPVSARQAALSAVQDRAAALLLAVAG